MIYLFFLTSGVASTEIEGSPRTFRNGANLVLTYLVWHSGFHTCEIMLISTSNGLN